MTEEVSRRESHGFTITSGLSPSPKSAPYKGKWQRLSQTMGDRESVDLPANQAESFIICLRRMGFNPRHEIIERNSYDKPIMKRVWKNWTPAP